MASKAEKKKKPKKKKTKKKKALYMWRPTKNLYCTCESHNGPVVAALSEWTCLAGHYRERA